jgi:hypothetical protein
MLHIHLDNKNGNKIVVAPASKWIYLLPYYPDVDDYLKNKKILCNYFQKISIFFLLISLVLLILKSMV